MLNPLPNFSAARVVVIGDVMLDRYWHGDTSRISPEAPVPVVHVKGDETRPGGAANVALGIASLGASVELIGLVGADPAAETLRTVLASKGIKCSLHTVTGHATVTKLRVLSKHQQLIRLDFEDPFSPAQAEALTEIYRAAIIRADVVVLSDYAKGTLSIAPWLIEVARQAGKPVVVDPKQPDFATYSGATVITPNWKEFCSAAGSVADESQLQAKAQQLLSQHALGALLVTRGERGMTLFADKSPAFNLATEAREVFDVTGAGDTVVAVLAASIGAGATLQDASRWANKAAGIVVGKLGTATVTAEELLGAATPRHPEVRGVIDETALLASVARAKARGEKIVMTNGCFDLLHAGHVQYLQQARALGDRLIIALNDDDSVKRLKGPERPLNNLANRAALLAALEAVDWVVPFSEDTPERVICAIQPHILVKGGDYQPDQIAGASCVRNAGGEVRVLEFLPGISTTGLIERMRGG